MREPLVRAQDVGRVFRAGATSVAAVVGASFTILPGERIALVGPSGSGKSTMLHLLGGLDRPTSGSLSWPGLGSRETLRPGPVAMAFQGPSLLPPLSVLENVELPILLAGGAEDEARQAAWALLERFEVDLVEDKLPEELSGGQSQRVGLARALAGRPRLILADEPTGQQDRETGSRVMDALLGGLVDGAALVVATHDREIAARLGARWTMEDGRLTPEAVPCSA